MAAAEHPGTLPWTQTSLARASAALTAAGEDGALAGQLALGRLVCPLITDGRGTYSVKTAKLVHVASNRFTIAARQALQALQRATSKGL